MGGHRACPAWQNETRVPVCQRESVNQPVDLSFFGTSTRGPGRWDALHLESRDSHFVHFMESRIGGCHRLSLRRGRSQSVFVEDGSC